MQGKRGGNSFSPILQPRAEGLHGKEGVLGSSPGEGFAACSFHVQQIELDFADSEGALDDLIAGTAGTTAVGYDLARVVLADAN